MQEQGLYPDPNIFVTVISRLGEHGKWDMIQKTIENMKCRGHMKSGIIYAVSVDIYGQYGKFQDALECISALKAEGLIPSASMFCVLANAYAQQGLCHQTVKVLQLMEAEGIEPNVIMLNVLINAFNVAGRYLEALSIYHHIKESVPEIYKEIERARCTPDRRARQMLQVALMVLQQRYCLM
nr:putative pentatricopeptide repeat-containing protein At5g36300 isoform X2 [Malus domestica]